MNPFVFPKELSAIGAVGEEGSPLPGKPFYRLSPTASVQLGVSAFCVVAVYGKSGVPTPGVQLLNLFPDGKGELLRSDASGRVQFNFGRDSAFSVPGQGPYTIFVAEGAIKSDDTKLISWENKLSDSVRSLGDWQGTHTEISIQFVEQETGVITPPTAVGNFLTRLRTIAYSAKGVPYNPDAAFPQFARLNRLGSPETPEFELTDDAGRTIVAQGFTMKIVYAEKGRWDQIKVADW